MYGKTIGKKFYEDGSIRRYPGNTVVADIVPGNTAYEAMTALREMVIERGFDKDLILLPEDSYHMTVIRGVNDQVRKDTHWPKSLSKEAHMNEVDDYISSAVARVRMPGKIRMKFDEMRYTPGCLVALTLPADGEQARILKEFRDGVAEEIGLHLPGHDEYRFHISLAYIRVIPEGEDEERFRRMLEDMNALLAAQPSFETEVPYMAFYDDMLRFSPERVPRD